MHAFTSNIIDLFYQRFCFALGFPASGGCEQIGKGWKEDQKAGRRGLHVGNSIRGAKMNSLKHVANEGHKDLVYMYIEHGMCLIQGKVYGLEPRNSLWQAY